MKKALIVIGILVAVAIAAWFMIGKKDNSGVLHRYVPEQSAVVFTMDLSSIFTKVDPAQLKERLLWKKMKSESREDSGTILLIEKAMADPEMTGIAFNTNPVLFVEPSGRDTRTGLILGISDKGKFKDFMQSLLPDQKIVEEDGRSIIREEDSRMIWVWDDDIALLYNHDNREEALLRADSILKKQITPITEHKLFKKASSKGKDLSIFLNNGALSNMNGANRELAFLSKSLGFPEEYAVTMGINFNAGKIEVEAKNIFNNEKDEEMATLTRSDAGVNYLGQTSEKAPIAAVQIQLDYQKLFDRLLDSKEGGESLKEIAEMAGVERKELRNLLSGDICFTYNGFSKEVSYQSFMEDMAFDTTFMPDVSLFVGVKDKAVMKKLLLASGLEPENGFYQVPFPFIGTIYLVETPEGLVLTLSNTNAGTLAKSGKLSDGNFGEISDFMKKGGNAAYINLDMSKMPPSFPEGMKAIGADYELADKLLKPLSHANFWSESGGAGKGEIAFKDAKANSLQQILDLIDSMVKTQEEMEAKRISEQDLMIQEEYMGEEMGVDEEVEISE